MDRISVYSEYGRKIGTLPMPAPWLLAREWFECALLEPLSPARVPGVDMNESTEARTVMFKCGYERRPGSKEEWRALTLVRGSIEQLDRLPGWQAE